MKTSFVLSELREWSKHTAPADQTTCDRVKEAIRTGRRNFITVCELNQALPDLKGAQVESALYRMLRAGEIRINEKEESTFLFQVTPA